MTNKTAELRRSGGCALRGLVSFLLHPNLDILENTDAISTKVLTLWLLVFSFAITAVFGFLALPLLFYAEAAPGKNLRTVFDQSAISVILATVVIGPLVEEVMFRGWLTGTVRALVGSIIFLTIWFGGVWAFRTYAQFSGPQLHLGLAAVGLLVFVAVNRNHQENAAAWYRSAFPFVFWAQGLVFGGLHFANISSTSPILPLLMTAPLVICGWLWGYARVRLGLGPAWMLHLAYNAPATMAIMAFGSA